MSCGMAYSLSLNNVRNLPCDMMRVNLPILADAPIRFYMYTGRIRGIRRTHVGIRLVYDTRRLGVAGTYSDGRARVVGCEIPSRA